MGADNAPRYLSDPALDIDTVLRAEAVFERYLRYKLAATRYTDTIAYSPEHGARLRHTPVVGIHAVSARTRRWDVGLRQFSVLGETGWVEIDVAHTVLHQKDNRASLIVPQSLFGTVYDEVTVEYTAGIDDIPPDVIDAVRSIYDGFVSGEINDWNIILPPIAHDVIGRYGRKEDVS